MKKKTSYELAEELVTESSVPPELSGFVFLAEAVVIKSENFDINFTAIYKLVGKNHGCKYRSIARSIAYAISKAERICEYLSITKSELYNSKVISLLALKLKARCKIALRHFPSKVRRCRLMPYSRVDVSATEKGSCRII